MSQLPRRVNDATQRGVKCCVKRKKGVIADITDLKLICGRSVDLHSGLRHSFTFFDWKQNAEIGSFASIQYPLLCRKQFRKRHHSYISQIESAKLCRLLEIGFGKSGTRLTVRDNMKVILDILYLLPLDTHSSTAFKCQPIGLWEFALKFWKENSKCGWPFCTKGHRLEWYTKDESNK